MYLGLQQTAFKQDQCLPFELANELSETQANKQVSTRVLLLRDATSLLLRQTLLEMFEDIHVGELALGEPCLRHDPEPRPQDAKGLRGVDDDDDGFLDRRARDVGGAVEQLRCVELARAGDAEE